MDSTSTTTKKETMFIPNLVRVFDDGSIERLENTPFVPPSLDHPSGVSSKDVVISKNPSISARFFLPTTLLHSYSYHLENNYKVPILVYFHGGGFFFESAFNQRHHDFFNSFVSIAEKVMVVSVEYRLAPETPLPAGYDDCFDALKWVATNTDPWLINHGDFHRVFIGGDSAGGNIVHNVALRAGAEPLPNGVKVLGAIVSHPFFFGSEPIGSEAVEGHGQSVPCLVWNLVYPNAPGGIDNPMINPWAPGAPSLAGLGCSKILVCVASKDSIRDRGVWYYEAVNKSGWKGEVELFEVEDEEHAFHIHNPEKENAKKMFKRLADFIIFQ